MLSSELTPQVLSGVERNWMPMDMVEYTTVTMMMDMSMLKVVTPKAPMPSTQAPKMASPRTP